MIENDVGNVLDLFMAGNRDGWKQRALCDRGVDGDEAFNAASHQHFGVGVQELGIMAVRYRKEEKSALAKVCFNSADHHSAVRVADLLGNDSNRKCALNTQR